MSATLDSRSLRWQEGWYKVSDGSTSLATDGPYDMKRVQKIKNKKYKPTKIRHSKKIQTAGSDTKSFQTLRNHIPVSDGITANQHAKIWNLENFEEVTEKLTSGRTVYMTVDATQCSKSGYPVPNRFHFGMEIDNFEISLDNRKFHGDVLKVSSIKNVLYENDIKKILREVKLYRDGTIVIDYYVIDTFSQHVTQQSMAVCRIHNSQTKDGQVKFTSDPFEDIKTIKSFGSLRSSLRKGRTAKMVVDLTKCSHVPDKTTIIGGKIKDYDFLGSGNNIAATFTKLISNSEMETILSSQNAFALFSNNNRMTITLKSQNISKNHSDFYLNKIMKYRCIISKDHKKNGLALFYT